MPTYAYACPACAKQAEEFRHVDERHNGPMCCGKPMVIEIRPAYAQPDLPGYESPVTGEWVEGRAARRADLAKAGCRPWEGLEVERQEAKRKQEYRERDLDRLAERMAHRAWADAPERLRKVFRGR